MLYGITYFVGHVFKRASDQFHMGVYCHFQDRDEKLMIFNIYGGQGWKHLCKFLNKPIPDIGFPHLNKRGD